MLVNSAALSEADAALRAFASAGADERSRNRFARSLRPSALTALLHHLQTSASGPAVDALRLLWASSLPRSELIAALLAAPSVSTLVAELDVLARGAKHLSVLTACAAAAARDPSDPSKLASSKVLLACARAAQIRPDPRARCAAARIVAVAVHILVDKAAAPADGVLALADAGFAVQAAAPAVRRANQLADREEAAPPLFHALLLLLPRVPAGNLRADVAAAAAQLAASARGAAARACMLAMQSAAAEDAIVADALLALYERSLEQVIEKTSSDKASERSGEGPVRLIGAMDVAFVYALLAQASAKKRCLALLHALCDAPSEVFAPGASAAGSSSAAARLDPPAERGRSRALLGALSVPGSEEHSALVADVCDSLARAPGAAARAWGARTLGALFRGHPSPRERVLHHVFSALAHADEADRAAPTAYISLLDELSQLADSAPLFRSHVPVLAHWLGYLTAMPFDAAVAVVAALACVAATLPALCDRLLLHLRKLGAARARVSRCLALHGLVALAAAPSTPAHVFGEVAALLATALTRARDTRVPALKLLADAVRTAAPGARSKRWLPLNTAVLAHLAAITGGPGGGPLSPALRLSDCFAPCCSGTAGLREAPLLLSYALALRAELAPSAALCSATESHIANAGAALASACVPPQVANPAAMAKWVSARVAMLAALCETFLVADNSPLTRVLPVYALAFVVRDAVPTAWRARPAHERSCPAATGADAPGGAIASALGTISARERCAHESLAESKWFGELEAAGAVSGACSLELAGCLRVLASLNAVEDAVGRYAASMLRAEVLLRIVVVFPGRDDPRVEDWGGDVMRVAKRAFVDTNPGRVEELPSKSLENSGGKIIVKSEQQKRARTSLRCASKQSSTSGQSARKRGRVSVPPIEVNAWSVKQKRLRGIPVPERPKIPESPGRSSSTSSMLGSAVDDLTSEGSLVMDTFREVEEAVQKMKYEPARDALAKVLEKRNFDCENARLSSRSSAVKLLLRGMSMEFNARQWGFLVGGDCRNSTAIECARELVSLFELDFKRSMSNSLALDYLELLSRFIDSSRNESEADATAIRCFLAETATRILKEYSISQIRIVRSLFGLLLSSLDDTVAIGVVQSTFEWLGVQQGVLDSQFKNEDGRVRFSDGNYDHDILEEAYALDGVVPDSQSSKATQEFTSPDDSASVVDEGKTRHNIATRSQKRRRTSPRTAAKDCTETEPVADKSPPADSLLPNGTKVNELGLNDTEESCLLCVQAALQRLDEALPSGETLRFMHTLEPDALIAELERLSQCTAAFRALLATQKQARGRGRITWARALVRRAAETLWRLLGAASSALEGTRREMRNADCQLDADHFGAVFSACARVLRATLGEDETARAARALCAGDGMACARARRAAARLELDAAAAVAELERHCSTDGVLEDLKAAYREIVGCTEVETSDAPAVAAKARKKRRVRSRNKVVDDWLEDENGEDDFADLEDFLVGCDEKDL